MNNLSPQLNYPEIESVEQDIDKDINKTFLQDVCEGLSTYPKRLPCKYFYDEQGSQLFEQICHTPEYYVTRVETALLKQIGADLGHILGEGVTLLEFGSGAGEKVRILLDNLQQPECYIPMDISSEILLRSAAQLREDYPDLNIDPWAGDYQKDLDQGLENRPAARRVVFFPGSTISNFDPEEAKRFLTNIKRWLGEEGRLVIGVDLIKADEVLNAAYNDQQGVTAAFNMNLLRRIQRELDTDINPDQFQHTAFFCSGKSRIEMHLESRVAQTICIEGENFTFAAGERIHTENSYKYSIQSFQTLAEGVGFSSERCWTDPDQYFSIHCLKS